MKAFKLYLRDIKSVFFKNYRVVIIPLMFWTFCRELTEMMHHYKINAEVSFVEYLLYCFSGADSAGSNEGIAFPVQWLSVMVLICFLTFDFMYRDLNPEGQQVLIRSGSRNKWWLSKCTATVSATVFCYALAMLTVLCYCLVHDSDISFACHQSTIEFITKSVCVNPDDIFPNLWQAVKCTVLLPIAVLTALNMIEMVLSLLFRPFVAFCILSMYIVASIYKTSPFAIGSYCMLTNSSLFRSEGFSIDFALIECAAIILLSAVVGLLIFRRYNVLQRKEDE